jgi:hypothetical protein
MDNDKSMDREINLLNKLVSTLENELSIEKQKLILANDTINNLKGLIY